MTRVSDPGARLAALAPRLALLVQHLAGRSVRRRVELEDLVQETFVRALTLPAGLPAGDVELWRLLTVLARHSVIDCARAIRAQRRDGHVVRLTRAEWSASGVHESAVAARTAGASTRAALVDETTRLRAAFDALAPEHRRVLGLRQFEGLSARETAQRMGRSETAVHSLYRRALEAWETRASAT